MEGAEQVGRLLQPFAGNFPQEGIFRLAEGRLAGEKEGGGKQQNKTFHGLLIFGETMMLQSCRLAPELWMKESVNENEGKIKQKFFLTHSNIET